MSTTLTAFWTLADWQRAYASGADPHTLLPALLASLEADDPAWISRLTPEALDQRLAGLAEQLSAAGGDLSALPLYGVPVGVKDNIDVAGLPTTCACPAFERMPAETASAVARLEAAGAVVLGKTNLDQFATGLVGTRSPYGVVPNSFNPEYISGGSSSGSASVVARGQVPIALGTDTAGSGRVPAGFNNLVGLKPTRGRLSTRGLVPACRSLDCISVFALDVDDADTALQVLSGFDALDPYSRRQPAQPAAVWPSAPVLGVPPAPRCGDDEVAERAYTRALEQLEAMGVVLRTVDFTPLLAVAALLYDGPWVAERYAALAEWMETRPEDLHPVVRGIVAQALGQTAVDAFTGEYRRVALARQVEQMMAGLDGLVVPTSPTICTIDAVLADPVRLNARLGQYTNFVNLLDWSALALPGGMREDGLPAGITLIAPAWCEADLLAFGRRWQVAQPWSRGASGLRLAPVSAVPGEDDVVVAVVGAHLTGMPLNHQLTDRGGVLLEATTTSADYRLYALPGTTPPKPGLVRTGTGAPIAVELWRLPVASYGSFVAGIPGPLGIGTLTLQDGRTVQGFICESWALDGADDITDWGGWRAFLQQRAA